MPLVALVTHGRTYTDFRPPLHGLTNAFSLAFMCLVPHAPKRRRWLWVAGAMVAFQVAIVHRGPALYHLLALGIGLASRSSRGGRIAGWKVASLVGASIVAFGLAGSLRQGPEFLVEEAFGLRPAFGWLPTGAVWALIYQASPTSNLLYNISLPESSCKPNVPAVLSTLIPGPLRNRALGFHPGEDVVLPCEISGDLFYPGLNVSTGYIQFFLDLGLAGLAVLSSIVGFAINVLRVRRFHSWGPEQAFVCVLLFVNAFAPAFNQLSFVATGVLLWLARLLPPSGASRRVRWRHGHQLLDPAPCGVENLNMGGARVRP